MNCKNCGAPLKPVADRDYFYCDHCGTFSFPRETGEGVRVLGEQSRAQCPLCRTVMVTASVAGERVLYCPKCRGMLAAQDTFPAIVKRLRAHARGASKPRRLDPQELERRTICPLCGRAMDTHPYAGPGNVVIDVCAPCGVLFLDHGELSLIRDAPGRDV